MIYQNEIGGHREGYAATISEITGLKIYQSKNLILDLRMLIQQKTIINICIEDGVISFFIISLIRAFLQKKTIGLMMSPWDCYRENKTTDIFRRNAFILLKKFSHVQTICIVPFDVDTRYKNIADHWIYDPEFWDMNVFKDRQTLLEEINEHNNAESQKINLLYFGHISEDKGFNFLARIFLNNKRLFSKFDLSIVGKIPNSYASEVAKLRESGANIIDDYVSDEYMLKLIMNSSILWCCYSEKYDASSGIFGRAIQFNKLPIIRKSSRLEKLAGILEKQVSSIEFENEDDAMLVLENIEKKLKTSQKKIDTYKLYSNARKVLDKCMST